MYHPQNVKKLFPVKRITRKPTKSRAELKTLLGRMPISLTHYMHFNNNNLTLLYINTVMTFIS